jgi:magnesium and cobalt exporter, CNNM family
VLGLFFAALFIALNGFFVAAEFALVKMSTTLPHGPRGPREPKHVARTREVVSRLDRHLTVTQFGVTLASLGLGWIGEPAIESRLDGLARLLTGGDIGSPVHVVLTVTAFAILTFTHVLLGELVPKLVAIQRSERIAHGSARVLQIVSVVFRPLLFALEQATRVILRFMGMSSEAVSEGALSEDELVGILAAQAARAPGGKQKSELFERVGRFADRTARHAMVPRVDIFSVPIASTGEEAARQLRTHEYSRVVLTKEKSVDEVAGYLYAKDFLLNPESPKLPSLDRLRREILFVPETQSLLRVLADMQRSQTPIAIVVDEYGGTSGLLTMEDLLEEIVGEIRDELDVEAARVLRAPGEEIAWDVDARATMDELKTAGVHVAEEESAEAVGTVVLARLGHIPRIGDKVDLTAEATAEITSVSRRRIMKIRLRVKVPVPAPSEA